MGVRRAVWNLLATAAVAATAAQVADRDARPTGAAPPRVVVAPPEPEPSPARPAVPATDTPFVQTGRTLLGAHLGLGATRGPQGLALRRVRVCTFVVVVPDPIDSRLDWQFDAGLESTRRGFEANGFVLERFWLPWTLDADSALRKRDRQHAPLDLRRRHPGVLLFRLASVLRPMSRAPQPDTVVALAYLVGETPTSGVHQAAFDEALADRADVQGATLPCPDPAARGVDELRVIGPTFSGSIQSVRRRVGTWVGLAGAARAPLPRRHATVVSGGTTASGAGVEMTRGAEGRIAYGATINAFDTLFGTLCGSVLDSALGMRQGEVAVINESNTVFGQAVRRGILVVDSAQRATAARDSAARATDAGQRTARASATVCERMLRVPFPMSISRLRTEYARHPANTGPAAPLTLGTTAARLPIDLQDPASNFENPPALSDLTTPALERVMDDIGQTLLAHRIRAVVVIATDVRDRIFVANEVKRRLRDMRIIFIGSHTLFTRPEFNEQLRGALVVSTYPLFLENQYWTRLSSESVERVVFSNELAEGAYNATLIQLAPITGYLQQRDSLAAERRVDTATVAAPLWDSARAGADRLSLDDARCTALRRGALADYRPPHHHDVHDSATILRGPRPPVWVTIIGRTTIAPVRAFPTEAENGVDTSRSLRFIARGCPLLDPDTLAVEAPPTRAGAWEAGLPMGAAFLLLVGLVDAFAPRRWRRRPARDIPTARRPQETRTEHVRLERSAELHAHVAGFVLPIIALCAAAPLLLVPLRALTHMWGIDRPMLLALAAAAALAMAFATTTAFLELRRVLAVASAARWDAGVQCVLVVALALVYVTSVATLVFNATLLRLPDTAQFFTRALQLSSGVTPIAPLTVGGLFLLAWAYGHRRRARAMRRVFGAEVWWPEAALALRKRLLALASGESSYALLVVVLTAGAWIATEIQRSPERIMGPRFASFDVVHRGMVFAVLAITTWTTMRLAQAALALRRLLSEIDALPYADAFGRLPPRLGSLARVAPLAAPSPEDAERMIRGELATRQRALERASPAAWTELFDRFTPGTMAASYWDFEEESGGRARVAATELFGALERDSPWRGTLPFRARATVPPIAEEIVALIGTDYIAWIIRHLRLLAIGLLAAIALGAWFLACYPFEPHTFVRICFFGVAGAGIVVILTILVQLNRDPVLSRLTHTNAGEVTWDLPFLANLAAVVGIPLVTILGSQFPEVRDFLFGWLAPLLRTVGRG